MAEGEAVAAGELRLGATLELVDHLALGEAIVADRDRKPTPPARTRPRPLPKRISPAKGWLRPYPRCTE
jgi:hypothetical protein